MRHFYTILLYLLTPFILLRLWIKGRKQPAYRERIPERLGFYRDNLPDSLWIHAVSMGETLAAVPLVKALQTLYPRLPIVMTTMTPTGAAQVEKSLGNSVKHVYLPYDFPGAIKRFLRAFHPVAGIIMETELWPNLLSICKAQAIPVCLLNARLSAKSAKAYASIQPLTRQILQNLTMIAAHGEADAKRFIQLGALSERVVVTGNLKFDIVLPNDLLEKAKILREQLGASRFVWIAASTHEGEEELILTAHQQLLQQDADALLMLVPRHPNRFDTVADLIQAKQISFARRSLNESPLQKQVYLGDTMGELLLLYAASNVAFVGGSLVARGGHNLLEPAALKKPILSGSHIFNFAEIGEMLIQAKGMLIVQDAQTLLQILLQLKNHPELQKDIGLKAESVVLQNRGALARQLEVVQNILDKLSRN